RAASSGSCIASRCARSPTAGFRKELQPRSSRTPHPLGSKIRSDLGGVVVVGFRYWHAVFHEGARATHPIRTRRLIARRPSQNAPDVAVVMLLGPTGPVLQKESRPLGIPLIHREAQHRGSPVSAAHGDRPTNLDHQSNRIETSRFHEIRKLAHL